MPKFVIEREIPKIGASTPAQYQGIAGQSCSVLEEMDPHIQWLHSSVYVRLPALIVGLFR